MTESDTGTSIKLSSLIKVTANSDNPAYLTIIGFDREDYAVGTGGTTGSLAGNGQSDLFSPYFYSDYINGVTFTYDQSSGRYYSQQYGYLDQMVYNTSSSAGDFTQFTVFASNDQVAATAYVDNPYIMMLNGSEFGEIGSIGVANQANTANPPKQATPDGLAAIAKTFVGRQWNTDGCWVLADTIATEAGAALPFASAYSGVKGQPTGEWTAVFDGPAGQNGNWENLVTAGDVIVIGNPQTGMSHITTCVAGSGATAQLVDNIALYGAWGNLINPSTDGSPADITIASPVSASLEWSQAATSDVVIYRLDTPVIADKSPAAGNLKEKSKISLSRLFSVGDPGHQAITEVQFYDSRGVTDGFKVNNGPLHTTFNDSTHCGLAGSLSAVTLVTGAKPGSDTIWVRAENSLGYWGDWQSETVSVGATAATGAISGMTTALNNQYDALVQGMAGLHGVLGGGEPPAQSLPQSDWPQMATPLQHG